MLPPSCNTTSSQQHILTARNHNHEDKRHFLHRRRGARAAHRDRHPQSRRRHTPPRAGRVASFGGRSIFTPENEALAECRHAGGEVPYELWRAGWNAGESVFRSDADVADNQTALIEYENGVRLSFHANTHAGILQRRWYFAGTDGAMVAGLTVMAADRAMREGSVVDCKPLWERLEKELRGR
ncbi:MAG: hypothetical protein H5U13_04670 [Parvibaculum sp.]|nr:hypothetical protein [Parvibaculum sp.]